MPLPTIRKTRFRGALVWEVDARALSAECQPRKIPVRRKFPTKAAAEQWARELMRRIEQEPAVRIEVRELCDHFLASREAHVGTETLRNYRASLGRLSRFCAAEHITYTDELTSRVAGDFSDHLHRSVADTSAAHYLTIAGVCFEWAVDRGYVSHNPFAGKGRRPRGKPRRILTDEERHRIVSETERADLWAFMLGTGLRVMEVVGLEEEHVRIQSPAPHIVVTGKGGKVRIVPLSAELAEIASRLLDAGGGRIWQDGRRWSIREAWNRDRDALGLPKDITLHVFRHDFASWLVNVESLPLPDVKRVLGHSKLSTTEVYLHPDGRRLAEAMSGRGRAVRWKQDGNKPREGRWAKDSGLQSVKKT